jgi:hypothetical protein
MRGKGLASLLRRLDLAEDVSLPVPVVSVADQKQMTNK